MPCTHTRKAASSGSSSPGVLGIPHLYDMHSSLPQQLGNFAFSKSRLLKGAFSWMERLVIRRSKVVIVICPQLEETVRGIDRDVPTVLIENAPGSGDTPREGSGTRVRVGARPGRRHADRALHRDLRGVPGTRPLVCGRTRRCRRPPGRALRSCRRTSGTDRAGARSRRGPRAWPEASCLPGSGPPKKFPSTSMPPTSWSRRAATAPTRRSRFINTCARAVRSSPRGSSPIRRCSTTRCRS